MLAAGTLRFPSSLAAMPSLTELVPTKTLESNSDPSDVFKDFAISPLKFEKATLSVSSSPSAKYVPLNKNSFDFAEPFKRLTNGVSTGDDLDPSEAKGSEGTDTNGVSGEIGPENGTGESTANGVDGVSTEWPRIMRPPPGLRNYSNTCYMNSTLQALMHVAPLVGYLLSGDHGTICFCLFIVVLIKRWIKLSNLCILST
jgi:hypothetical protein